LSGNDEMDHHLCNDDILIILQQDCNFLQDWGQLPAVPTPRSIKLDQYCEEKIMSCAKEKKRKDHVTG
jgi:hypothetical protein